MSLLRSGAVISAMTLVSRVLGLVRDVIIARYFPVSGATDAFFVAFKIPNLLRRLFAEGAFSLAFVPVLSEYREKRSREELKDLIDHVAGMMSVILGIISLVGIIASPFLVMLFAPGFSEDNHQQALAADLLKITFPYILFISLTALASGILNTYNRFAVPAFTPVLMNVAMIIAAVWFAPYFDEPVTALAWGVFFAGISQLLFQMFFLMRMGLLPRPRFKRTHKGVKKIMRLMIPALFGSSVAQINLLLNTIIASFLVAGSISWLYFSDRFVELPLALFGVAIGTVILPRLSREHARESSDDFVRTLDWAMRLAVLIALPAMLGLVVLAQPILASVIMYGAFTWHDVEMASLSLMTYALGLPAFILVKVLAPGFYSRQDTKTPVKIGIIALFSNMLLNITIVLPWYLNGFAGAHAGLALATALAGYINAILLFYYLRKRQIYRAQSGWWLYSSRVVAASGGMFALLLWLKPEAAWWMDAVGWDKALYLAGLILAAAASYFILLLISGLNFRQLLRHRR